MSDVDLQKAKPRAEQAAVCAKTQQGNKIFLASRHIYSVSKVIMKFVHSMPPFVSCEINDMHNR